MSGHMPPAGLSARGLSTLMDHGQPDARHRSERFLLHPENGSSNSNTANSSPRYQHNSRTSNHSTRYRRYYVQTIYMLVNVPDFLEIGCQERVAYFVF